MKPNPEAFIEHSLKVLDDLGISIVDIRDLTSELATNALVVERVEGEEGDLISIKLGDDYIAEFHVDGNEVKPFIPYLSDSVIVSMPNHEGELILYSVGFGYDITETD